MNPNSINDDMPVCRLLFAIALTHVCVSGEDRGTHWDRLDNVGYEGVVIGTAVTGKQVPIHECQQACEAQPRCAGFAFNGSCVPLLAKSWRTAGEALGTSVFLKPNIALGFRTESLQGKDATGASSGVIYGASPYYIDDRDDTQCDARGEAWCKDGITSAMPFEGDRMFEWQCAISASERANPHWHCHLSGYDCSCTAERTCKPPTIAKGVAFFPKTGTNVWMAYQLALSALLPSECVWFADNPASEFRPEDVAKHGGAILPHTDFRMLLGVRDPFAWFVSAYSYYALNGYEYDEYEPTCNSRCRPVGPDYSNSTHCESDLIRRVVNSEQGAKLRIPAMGARETYGQFARRITVRQGVTVEYLRAVAPESASPYWRMVAAVQNTQHDSRVMNVCADSLESSDGFERVLTVEALAHLQVQGAVSAPRLEAARQRILTLDWKRPALKAAKTARSSDTTFTDELAAHASKMTRPMKKCIAGLVRGLDQQLWRGVVASHAKLLGCTAELPPLLTAGAAAACLFDDELHGNGSMPAAEWARAMGMELPELPRGLGCDQSW
jgi:hypothetical protein